MANWESWHPFARGTHIAPCEVTVRAISSARHKADGTSEPTSRIIVAKASSDAARYAALELTRDEALDMVRIIARQYGIVLDTTRVAR